MLDDIANVSKGTRYLNTSPSIRIFSWLDNPNVRIFLLLELLVRSTELAILCITIVWRLHVESQGNGNFKRIDAHRTIVHAYVKEESLFVRKVIIIVQSIVDQSWYIG